MTFPKKIITGAYLEGGRTGDPPKLSKVKGKIIKTVATRCQILWLKCTKFNLGWGSAPDLTGSAYSAPLDPLAGFLGPTCTGGRGGEGAGEGEREGEELREKEEGREGGNWGAAASSL